MLRQIKRLVNMQLFFSFYIMSIGKRESDPSTTVHMHHLLVDAVSNCLCCLVAINGNVCC